MTFLLNLIKIYRFVQKLLGGTHRYTNGQADRQDGDLISLTFLFKESRLKNHLRDHLSYRRRFGAFSIIRAEKVLLIFTSKGATRAKSNFPFLFSTSGL
jgi:hypothetical protein